MQPTNQLLGVQFRVEIRLVTNAVSHETLLISDFLSHCNNLRMRHSSQVEVGDYSPTTGSSHYGFAKCWSALFLAVEVENR
jgi:hypothetical protein